MAYFDKKVIQEKTIESLPVLISSILVLILWTFLKDLCSYFYTKFLLHIPPSTKYIIFLALFAVLLQQILAKRHLRSKIKKLEKSSKPFLVQLKEDLEKTNNGMSEEEIELFRDILNKVQRPFDENITIRRDL